MASNTGVDDTTDKLIIKERRESDECSPLLQYLLDGLLISWFYLNELLK